MKKSLNDTLQEYKKFLVPLALNLASVFIVFGVIFPQITSIPESLENISQAKQTVATLKNSLNTVATTPDAQVDENYATSVHALPTVKDLSLIFTALSNASAVSNTQLEEFSLNVGGVFGRAAQQESAVGAAPSIILNAQVVGSDARSLVLFTNELTSNLPLSEINKLSSTDNSATYEIGFFYKPYDLSKVREQDKVPPLSQSETNLLNKLKEWEQ